MRGKFQIFPFRADWAVPPLDRDIWYWRYRSSNGRIMSIGGEPFRTVAGAKRSIYRFLDNMGATDIPDIVVRKR